MKILIAFTMLSLVLLGILTLRAYVANLEYHRVWGFWLFLFCCFLLALLILWTKVYEFVPDEDKAPNSEYIVNNVSKIKLIKISQDVENNNFRMPVCTVS